MKTFREILEGKGLIINSLSMASRISEDTIRGICSGRVNLGKCYRDTLAKLAEALDMQPEELAEVGLEAETTGGMMCPETGYPPSIEKAITDLLEGEKRNVLHLDWLWGELYGAVNASQWDGTITIEQADYLRKKYLFGNVEPEETPDTDSPVQGI